MTPEQQKAIDDGSTNKQKVHPTTLVTSANINKTKELFFIGNYFEDEFQKILDGK